MTDAQFDETMERYDLPKYQVQDIKDASPNDRNGKFHEAMHWLELHQAKVASHAFSEALSHGGIYINDETYQRLSDFDYKLRRAIQIYGINHDYPQREKEEDDASQFRDHGREWFVELGAFLRARYWQVPNEDAQAAIEANAQPKLTDQR